MINISNYIIPFIVLGILGYGIHKKKPIYDDFIEGANEGLKLSITLLPYLLSMILAVNIFIDSNILDLLFKLIAPILNILHIPFEIFPMFFLRPLSSSASLAYVTNLLSTYGPDSFIGILSTIIQGSTDTTIYIITIYMGSIGIKKTKYTLRVSLLADIFGILMCVLLINIFFNK